ncbi:MAG: response regulator [bacterium]|nr:response regulator [bacterium]
MEFYRESLKAEEVTYHNVSLFPLDTEGAGGVAIRIDDITEMEKKEEQLRQSQKMEIVGTLAGGLAHDFNNVLGGITGALSIINNRMKKKPDMPIGQMSDFFQVIGESAERAVEMVQQVLSLSRKSNVAFAPMDLNKSLDRVIKICQNTFDKSIELKPRYADGKAVVNGNATQLDQVLLNLCVNASHAMTIMRPEGETPGGFLEIKIDKIAAGRHFVSTHPEASEIDYWHVAVEDSGVGMNGDTMAKIFDPFFTTKHGVSKGTGLGLAMVYNLVRQHLGFIDIYSEPGEGTVFNVYVPVYYSDVAAADKKDNDELIYGEGLILVVDDESVMLHMTREILTDCGYDVVTAVNGEDGVRIFRNLEKKIRGVILDVMMPRMSGKEAFVEMKKIDPDIKVLVISGYKHHERIEELYALGIKEFLQKPYTAHKLSDALWRILG